MSKLMFGDSAILRISGCPIQFWLAATNPDLFSRVRQLNQLQDRYCKLSAHLADQIGSTLVPHTALSRHDRRLALNLRRQLHNGLPVSKTACRQLADVIHRVMGQMSRLIDELKKAERYAEELSALEAEVTQAITEEQARLPRVAWEFICSSPITREMLRTRNSQVYRSIETHVRRGRAWSSKGLRKNCEYVWQLIDRAATMSTPRDWHGHVALLLAHPRASALSSITVTAEFATEWIENIYLRHRALSDRPLAQADLETNLVFTALQWPENGHLRCWIVDPGDSTRMVELHLRRTSLLDALYSILRSGPTTINELEAEILDGGDEQQDVLLQFIEHLIGLGVLQVALPLGGNLRSWHQIVASDSDERGSINRDAASAHHAANAAAVSFRSPAAGHERGDGYFDVYRQTATELPPAKIMHFQRLMQQALRVLALIDDDRVAAANPLAVKVDGQPKLVLELLRERIEADETSRLRGMQSVSWPPASTTGSPYLRLLDWMATRADDLTVIDIDKALLDELQASEGVINWPIDCVLRLPGDDAGFAAVLDRIIAAGVIDARFVNALSRLHGPILHADAYHQFLQCLEEKSGTTLVEVLIPPLSRYGANAVRRPIYTGAWTGDADIHTYCPSDRPLPKYIPLDAITLRRTDRGLVAEADGHPIWPMYHATRSPMPPWNLLSEILFSAAPLPMRWHQRPLHHVFKAFPDRKYMPRITVDGALVLSCAQWRLSPDNLWDLNASDLAKARVLERLRRDLQLPRWVFVSSHYGRKPMPCDLESLRAIRMLERMAQAADSELVLAEMLPAPDQLLVADRVYGPGNQLVSEIVFRLPSDESPTEMAARLAPQFSQAFN